MDVFSQAVSESPNEVILVDDVRTQGWTRTEVDNLSGRVYSWLNKHNIGREDFVLIKLPRSGLPLIAMIGVWKAGAAFTGFYSR